VVSETEIGGLATNVPDLLEVAVGELGHPSEAAAPELAAHERWVGRRSVPIAGIARQAARCKPARGEDHLGLLGS
jgi:hypothetical protein